MSTQLSTPWSHYFDAALGLSTPISVRTLRAGELLPFNLPHGLHPNFVSPQPDWIWLVESEAEAVAMLIAAPAQNIVYLMRICASANSPTISSRSLLLLLRTAFATFRARGYIGYMVNLGESPTEIKLMRLLKRAAKGKEIITSGLSLVGAPTDIGGL